LFTTNMTLGALRDIADMNNVNFPSFGLVGSHCLLSATMICDPISVVRGYGNYRNAERNDSSAPQETLRMDGKIQRRADSSCLGFLSEHQFTSCVEV